MLREKKHLKVYLLNSHMKCKEIYHLNMQIILLKFQFHMQYIKLSGGVQGAFYSFSKSSETLFSLRNVPTVFGIKGHK